MIKKLITLSVILLFIVLNIQATPTIVTGDGAIDCKGAIYKDPVPVMAVTVQSDLGVKLPWSELDIKDNNQDINIKFNNSSSKDVLIHLYDFSNPEYKDKLSSEVSSGNFADLSLSTQSGENIGVSIVPGKVASKETVPAGVNNKYTHIYKNDSGVLLGGDLSTNTATTLGEDYIYGKGYRICTLKSSDLVYSPTLRVYRPGGVLSYNKVDFKVKFIIEMDATRT